jgi:hypothetical protein
MMELYRNSIGQTGGGASTRMTLVPSEIRMWYLLNTIRIPVKLAGLIVSYIKQ